MLKVFEEARKWVIKGASFEEKVGGLFDVNMSGIPLADLEYGCISLLGYDDVTTTGKEADLARDMRGLVRDESITAKELYESRGRGPLLKNACYIFLHTLLEYELFISRLSEALGYEEKITPPFFEGCMETLKYLVSETFKGLSDSEKKEVFDKLGEYGKYSILSRIKEWNNSCGINSKFKATTFYLGTVGIEIKE